jgi:hypothetical protein
MIPDIIAALPARDDVRTVKTLAWLLNKRGKAARPVSCDLHPRAHPPDGVA